MCIRERERERERERDRDRGVNCGIDKRAFLVLLLFFISLSVRLKQISGERGIESCMGVDKESAFFVSVLAESVIVSLSSI